MQERAHHKRARFDWSAPVDNRQAFARAGGRRRYNALRRLHMVFRRAQVARLLHSERGHQAAIARRLGVSQATISRDVKALLRESLVEQCPHCGGTLGGRVALDCEYDQAWQLLAELDKRGLSVFEVTRQVLAQETTAEPASESEREDWASL